MEDIKGASGDNFSPLLLLPPTANCFFVPAVRERRGEERTAMTVQAQLSSAQWKYGLAGWLDRSGQTAHWVKDRTGDGAGWDWDCTFQGVEICRQFCLPQSYTSSLARSHVRLTQLCTVHRARTVPALRGKTIQGRQQIRKNHILYWTFIFFR